ncbi:ABC transporter permease [Lacrimispora sp. 38-1]|uniref:ABC transporter permease n=1 Tax=Lacrimispora sp. 38-1 TaxID=3125778 RepID=UPI003CEDCCDC
MTERNNNDDFTFIQDISLQMCSENEEKSAGFFQDAMVRLLKNKASIITMVVILLISLFAILGPSMSKYGYNDQDVTRTNLPPKIPVLEKLHIADGTMILYNKAESSLTDKNKFPEGSVVEITNRYKSSGVSMVDVKVDMYKYSNVEEGVYYICGTDYLGRDLFTRLWRGARVSLMIAVLSVAVNICIGLLYGSIAGFYGGKIDMVLMRLVEIISAFPQVIIATMLILFLGTGIKAIVIALIIRGWVATAKMIRGQFFRFKEREYVLAAKTLGVSDFKLIFRYIMPNSIGPIITKAMLEIPSAIFAESFLAFIGLGVQAPEPSIGVLLSDAQKVLITYPYQMLFPAVLISILMVCFNLFGNGLRDAFDPTMRGLE